METEIIFYYTDESFDYGNSQWGGIHYVNAPHGFTVNLINGVDIDLATLKGFGDFATDISKIKTLPELKEYITNNLEDVEDEENRQNIKDFLELIDFNIKEAA